MRILILVLTLLVSILGVISKGQKGEENEEIEVQLDDDILDIEDLDELDDMELDRHYKRKKKSGKQRCTKNSWLVTTGGDNNETLWRSSEIIGYLGVCTHPKIPPLNTKTTGGQSVWLPSTDTLMFCGGSNEYIYVEPDADNWGATDKCFNLKPGGTWKTDLNGNNWMKTARGWFSMTRVGKGKVIAAGGHDGDGNALDTMEMYSKGKWEIMDIVLPNATFGHCAVHYRAGKMKNMNSYLMIIGGSSNPKRPILHPDGCDCPDICYFPPLCPLCCFPPWAPSNSGYALRINLDTGKIDHVNHWPLPPMWAPACKLVGEDIYVSGGAVPDIYGFGVTESSGVYKYNIKKDTWSEVGNFQYGRWGHVMGTTSRGQMVIAGGYAGTDLNTFNNIESSDNNGVTWTVRHPGLKTGGQYMAMAQVPASTFECKNDNSGSCRKAFCETLGDCDETCGICQPYNSNSGSQFGVCEEFPPPVV